ERGIKQRHGYLREMFAEHPDFLVAVPPDLRQVAVLLEPLSVVEKVFRQIAAIQQRMCWEPERALITGAGSVGFLAVFLARLRNLRVLLYSRGVPRGDEITLIRTLALHYVDSEDTSLSDSAESFGK